MTDEQTPDVDGADVGLTEAEASRLRNTLVLSHPSAVWVNVRAAVVHIAAARVAAAVAAEREAREARAGRDQRRYESTTKNPMHLSPGDRFRHYVRATDERVLVEVVSHPSRPEGTGVVHVPVRILSANAHWPVSSSPTLVYLLEDTLTLVHNGEGEEHPADEGRHSYRISVWLHVRADDKFDAESKALALLPEGAEVFETLREEG